MKHGTKEHKEFMRKIGSKGGKAKNPRKGFGTNRGLASIVGRKGGQVSRKGNK